MAKSRKVASISEILKPESKVKTVRVQLTLNSKYAHELERLRLLKNLDTYTEVFREALRVYGHISKNMEEEDKLVIEKTNGIRYHVLL